MRSPRGSVNTPFRQSKRQIKQGRALPPKCQLRHRDLACLATQRAQAPRDLRRRHRDHLHRHREPAQRVDEFGFIGNADEALGDISHDLFACERRATAFDHAAAVVDLVGPIDVDRNARHRVAVEHRDAVAREAA